jgi:Domain of unknown function (DUF4440)
MTSKIIGLSIMLFGAQALYAQQPPTESIKTATNNTPEQQEIINLSKRKWDWMSDKNVDSLNVLFDDKSMFIHMGGSWGKNQEINTIKTGGIWYKKAEVYAVIVNMFGNTAILLNDIDLVAQVGGREVTFSHLMRPVKMNMNNNQP